MGILQTGFKNVFRGNTATGFQVPVENSYYRGIYVSLIEGFDITIDGETFSRDQVTCTFGSTTLSQDELEGSKERWQFNDYRTPRQREPGRRRHRRSNRRFPGTGQQRQGTGCLSELLASFRVSQARPGNLPGSRTIPDGMCAP